jgi:hypothetical protein
MTDTTTSATDVATSTADRVTSGADVRPSMKKGDTFTVQVCPSPADGHTSRTIRQGGFYGTL